MRTASVMVLSALSLAVFSGMAHSEGDYIQSGGPKNHVSVGFYTVIPSDSYARDILDNSNAKTEGATVAYTYSFFRPTRHEATLTVQFAFRAMSNLNEDQAWAVEKRIARVAGHGAVLASAEYRWRFGPEGRAYYGTGVGAGVSKGKSFVLSTGSLGYEFNNKVFAEVRAYTDERQGLFSSLMIGTKF